MNHGAVPWVGMLARFASSRTQNSLPAEVLPAEVSPSAESSTVHGCQRRWTRPTPTFSPLNPLWKPRAESVSVMSPAALRPIPSQPSARPTPDAVRVSARAGRWASTGSILNFSFDSQIVCAYSLEKYYLNANFTLTSWWGGGFKTLI